MSEYKLDMSKYTIDEQPRMWTDAEYREAFQSLYFEYHKIKSERDKLEAQKIEFARSYKRVVEENEKLEVENEKLKIKNEYLLKVIKMSEHIQMHTDLEEN